MDFSRSSNPLRSRLVKIHAGRENEYELKEAMKDRSGRNEKKKTHLLHHHQCLVQDEFPKKNKTFFSETLKATFLVRE